MATLLDKTRAISRLLQLRQTFDMSADLPYNKIAGTLADVIDSNTYIIDDGGKVLGFIEKHQVNNERIQEMFASKQFPKAYTDAVELVQLTKENIPVTDQLTAFPEELQDEYPNGLTTIVPIYVSGQRLGAFILSREDNDFNDEDLVLAEYAASVVGMQLLYQETKDIEEKVRSSTAVHMAISTLSYSELKAVKAILGALDGDEGRLTASQIADEIGITRSVIVNALRKLESAGIIESRSLGMKGTYLKILNKDILAELDNQNI